MKKCWLSRLSATREDVLKCFLIMKLTVLLLLMGFVQVFGKGYSQDKMSISLKDVKLKYALTYIQHNSSYRFIYNDDLFNRPTLVSLQVKDASIYQVLNSLFQSTDLAYHVMDNNLVVISKQNAPAAEPIKGIISLIGATGSQSGSRAGISVLEKGTNNGTTTNEAGEFSLDVTSPNAVLIISSVGFQTKEVALGGRTTVNIELEISTGQMQDVVVTALGITRQKKSLTYATQTLKGSELSDTREFNVTSAMDGKVANMTISKTNSGPGSSNRIIFRGNRSISGTNQPLIVVDGVRIDNSAKGFNDVTGNVALNRDNGDGISNINPDDIESMTVLTGASAAALYGSDAANGAVIITTKKGHSGKGVGIQISSSATWETPMVYPPFQNTYGQGVGGAFVSTSDQSWGAKMSGQEVVDWTGKAQAQTPQPGNAKDFFVTGNELVNSVAISTGNEKAQTYFSYTNNYSNGILPNNQYKRNNLNLRQTVQLTSQLSLDFKANYIAENISNRPLAGGGNHAVSTIFAMPRSLRLNDIKNFEYFDLSTLSLKQNYWADQTPAYQNPYWSTERNLYDRNRERFIGLVSLRYQITPELSIQGRSSLDYYTDKGQDEDYNDTYWITYPGGGNFILNNESNKQFNNDILINYNKNLSSTLSLNVNAGASIEQFTFQGLNSNDQGLIIPNKFSLGNGLAVLSTNSYQRTEKQSVYVAAELGYKNFLFLDLTGRNDWNSTLPVSNNSYFFPSVGVSAVLSDMLKMPASISLLKVRGSYAYVGNGTAFNQIKESPYIGPGGNGGFLYVDRLLKNANLKPEETRSLEFGLDYRMFNNRLGLELTLYKTNTINQILQIGVPSPSGYAFRIINAGNVQNKGIELLLNGRPVDGPNFKWIVSFNFGMNKNKIIYLDSLQKMPPLASPETLGQIVAEEGKAYGGIYTTSFVRNASNQIVVDANGLPLVNGNQFDYYAGNYNPDWTAGITNTFIYKNWNFSFLIDERKGGIMISGTQAMMAAQGTSENTVANRETGFVVPNSVMEDGSKNSIVISPQDYWSYVGGSNLVGELFVNDATTIRLRQVSLTYSLPAKVLSKTFINGVSLTLMGRNLFFIKNNAVGFDPETALGTGNNQGLEFAALPSTRSYGLFLKMNF